ncbi:hypothetical protein DL771_003406 [Monosporascus sp. 5C6A]|nr:hypothetical protein DL771_003406 [Monosporascus sp. 5C6A]
MPDDRLSSSVGGPALKAVFCALGFLGFLATWSRTIAHSSLALMQESLKGELILPSTEHALRDSFSGMAPLDYIARTLVVFVLEAIDGSHPRTSAAGIYMAG